MKRIIASIVVVMLTIPSLFAQETLRDVVKDYQRDNSEFSIFIPTFIIKVGIAFGDLEKEEREILKQIDDMRIVISENGFYKEDLVGLEEGIKSGKFTELMTVQEYDEKVRMIMHKKNKRCSEMLMLVESENETVMLLFDFKGEPDFKKFLALVN